MKLTALFLASILTLLTGCSPRAPKNEYAEVAPNETAFLIALDGNTKDKQQKLDSVAYLESNKVQAKRVMITHININKCPDAMLGCWDDVPSVKLLKISRTPVSREWTSSTTTGTSAADESFHVGSLDSIAFSYGATITAHIDEANTAQFLYSFAGTQLSAIMDSTIRSYIGSALSHEFADLTVAQGAAQKVKIFSKVFADAKQHFAAQGITIDNFGFLDVMHYDDEAIQQAINKKFEADMQIQIADAQVMAAQKFAAAKDSIMQMQAVENAKKLTDAQAHMMLSWDGHSMPQYLNGSDSMFSPMFYAPKK